ncbi:CUB domain-containing protein 2-like [Oculina patagonica]
MSETIECGSVVNNTLTSPGYPDNYPNKMDCNYSVPIPHDRALKITFYEFDVEGAKDCEYDYLEITNEKGKTFGKYCSQKNNKEINVTGRYAELHFHSDSDVRKRGFLLLFNIVSLPECGRVINNTLTSPGYPNDYPNNMDCIYSVPIPPGMAILIHLHDFDVEYYPSKPSLCPYDYLKITNERKNNIRRYCGKRTGTHVAVTGNYALLTFNSDYYSSHARGFKIVFTFVYCGAQCSFEWDTLYGGLRLFCWNITSLFDVIKCSPRIITNLEVSSSKLKLLPVGTFSNLTNLRDL